MKRATSNYIIILMIIVFVFLIHIGNMADGKWEVGSGKREEVGSGVPLPSVIYEGKWSSVVFADDSTPKNDDVEEDEDEDDTETMKQGISQKKGDGKPPIQYLPVDPNVKKLKLKAMDLAEKFTRILALRSKLQPELAKLESNEAELRYLRLKYQIEYLKKRDKLMDKYPGNKKIHDMLMRHDGVILHIDELIYREEKIDCYHTIYERKHRAMEEYHWNILDNKHPLIAEYLQDRSWKENKEEIKELYGDIIIDYIRIIKENTEILEKTKQIIKEKKKREKIMRKIVNEWKKLLDEVGRWKLKVGGWRYVERVFRPAIRC